MIPISSLFACLFCGLPANYPAHVQYMYVPLYETSQSYFASALFSSPAGGCPGTNGLGWDLNIFYVVINPGGDDDDAIVQLIFI